MIIIAGDLHSFLEQLSVAQML